MLRVKSIPIWELWRDMEFIVKKPSDVDEGRWKKTKMLAIGLICLYLGDSVHVFDRGLHVDDARGIMSDRGRSSGQVVDGCRCGRRVTVEEPSPQQGGEVSLVTADVFDRGLHVDDARGIRGDRSRSLSQVVDGCRWNCKHF